MSKQPDITPINWGLKSGVKTNTVKQTRTAKENTNMSYLYESRYHHWQHSGMKHNPNLIRLIIPKLYERLKTKHRGIIYAKFLPKKKQPWQSCGFTMEPWQLVGSLAVLTLHQIQFWVHATKEKSSKLPQKGKKSRWGLRMISLF